jgi:PiT family inorganic phosphate transporter
VGVAWLITLPCAALCGAVSFYAAKALGYSLGEVVMGVVLALYCGFIFLRSRRDKINANNVNDKWDEPDETFEKPASKVDASDNQLVGV